MFTQVSIYTEAGKSDLVDSTQDIISLSLIASEDVTLPSVFINNARATVSFPSPNNKKRISAKLASSLIRQADVVNINFVIGNYFDVMSIGGVNVSATTDGSSVKFEVAEPTINATVYDQAVTMTVKLKMDVASVASSFRSDFVQVFLV